MIEDKETNFLYLAKSLKDEKRHSTFYSRFVDILNEENIQFKILEPTKDIWTVDYMPLQVTKGLYVQFKYFPDYLVHQRLEHTISDTDAICKNEKIFTKKSTLKLDGGNVIKERNKVIICDKVFSDNESKSETQVESELKTILEVEEIIFVPLNKPHDKIGHADGMVRFIDKDNVIVNDLSKETKTYQKLFRSCLEKAKFNWKEVPYNPYNPKNQWDATGIYINYLQMSDLIFVPTFGMKEDEIALKIFSEIFPSYKIVPIKSNEIAKDGGILNCISWNIMK